MKRRHNAKLSPRRLAAILKKRFRLLYAACPRLRAEWDYIIGSGVPGRWTLDGGADSAKAQFEDLVTRAAFLLPDAGDVAPLVIWCEALRRERLNFSHGRETIESDSEGNEHARHLSGTIERLCEASANYCALLESRALADERRAQQQADEQSAAPAQADAAGIAGLKGIRQNSEGSELKAAGQEIDRLRKEGRLTMEDLAKAINSTPRTVQRHIAGENKPLPRCVAAYERVFSMLLKRKIVI